MNRIASLSLACRALLLTTGAAAMVAAVAQTSPATARATLAPTTAADAKGVAGTATLTQRGQKVLVEATVTGLAPNTEHGFHVHANPDCSGDGTAAGDHFNPDKNPHAHPSQPMRHPGAMFNLKADASGTAKFSQEVDVVTLTPGKYAIVGLPLMVHAKPDDYASQPSGNAGPRLACGLITAG